MDVYDINQYTDEQLYEILDMNHPTDRELEAKIIQMINKYENISTEIGKKLYSFFDSIYKRFFSTDSDTEDENIKEGMTNSQMTTTPVETVSTQIGYQPQNIASVQQFNYAPDKLQLNPLLSQTIKRVISIDSQYRNITTYPSTTSFSFDLSEPLRDVVSLKLYSIQIPYTWYTIGKAYGSNFFYLSGNSPGVNDSAHSYKIEIAPGNYDQKTLPAALNTAFNDLSNNSASDVNFNGLLLITYDEQSAKTTVNLNIQNTFNEIYYYLNFPFFTYPTDLLNNKKSIPGYLGFNNSYYDINTITSNQSYITTAVYNTQTSQDYVLDNSNNYFTVIQYLGYSPDSAYDSRSTILNSITINLTQNGFPYTGSVTRENIITAVNSAIYYYNYFDSNSEIISYPETDISNVNYGKTYFKLKLQFNRNKIKYVPNAKIVVIFPTETIKTNSYKETYTIWQRQIGTQYSCFYFENTVNEISAFTTESPVVNSSFTINSGTYINMTCTLPTYKNNLNNFSMYIPSGTYNTLSSYLSTITNSFAQKNTATNQYFNMTNTEAIIDLTNTFILQLDMIKSFNNKNYAITIDGNSFLYDNPFIKSYSIVTNIPNPSTPSNKTPLTYNLYDISYINISIAYQNSYQVAIGNIFYVNPSTTYGNIGNASGNTITSTLPLRNGSYNLLSPNDFINTLTNSIISTVYINQTVFSKSLVNSIIHFGDSIDISLNINCNFFLSEQNYDVSFVDISYNENHSLINSWSYFNIDLSGGYDLSNNNLNGFSVIRGEQPISSNLMSSIQLIDNCNNTIILNTNNTNIPTDSITLTIPSGSYTIATLNKEINSALSTNPRTFGSYIKSVNINSQTYTYFWLNINRIFTTQDYILDFYNPINFVSCYAGTSSVQNTTWDSTIGWILGFRDYTQYYLTTQNQTINTGNTGNPSYYKQSSSGKYTITQIKPNEFSSIITSVPVTITGDTSLSTNLYNYFLISLDDFIQNHLNDGLVTITRSQTSIQIPEYSYSTTQICDPATGELVNNQTQQTNSDNVTAKQLYALNQSTISQQNPNKEYSPGPFIKDLFGIIPVKPPSNTGDYYTEFGGSLQNQERLYFGPVNIRKMAIQLLTDRGTTVDLNNSNWSFSFVCEQLYRATST